MFFSLFLPNHMIKRIIHLIFLFTAWTYGQEISPSYNFEMDYYYGSIMPHSKKIMHLITEHPEGLFLTANRQTFGEKAWQSRLNYPDYGLSFHYQNNKNPTLGDLYGLFFHYNFYFFKRNLQFRIAQGLAYNTNPYDKNNNYRNLAYGAQFMPATYFMISYDKQNIWEGLGIRAGLFLIHHSNAKLRTPNTSTNTVGAKFGLSYNLDHKNEKTYLPDVFKDSTYTEPFKINLAFRGGFHESPIVGSGRYPFYNFSAYVDKRISRSSAFQVGMDLFLSRMRKREIKMMSIVFHEKEVDHDADYKRVGAFVGYEFFISKLSFEPQFGFYVYNKYNQDKSMYQRLTLKYYLTPKIFAGAGLLSQFSKAEAMELSVGIRI